MNLFPINAPALRRALLAWYRKNGRDLPWRRTRDPYAILVSEIMLQQTQVATVLPYYTRWMERFPTAAALAGASESDVLHAWQGLGYYSRARNFHAAARMIADEFPRSLHHLPGVGHYTANAVATFAFNQRVPIVEANIARLLARLQNLQMAIDSAPGRRVLWDFAAALLPKHGARTFNSALMDLGALVCIPRAPMCPQCPVRAFCRATDPATLPRKRPRRATVQLAEHHALVRRNGHILLAQSRARWRGMWILPRIAAQPTNEKPLHLAEFPFTHHRVTLAVYRGARRASLADERWFARERLDAIPIPSPHRRALDALLPN